jgi:hypothetical protein
MPLDLLPLGLGAVRRPRSDHTYAMQVSITGVTQYDGQYSFKIQDGFLSHAAESLSES